MNLKGERPLLSFAASARLSTRTVISAMARIFADRAFSFGIAASAVGATLALVATIAAVFAYRAGGHICTVGGVNKC